MPSAHTTDVGNRFDNAHPLDRLVAMMDLPVQVDEVQRMLHETKRASQSLIEADAGNKQRLSSLEKSQAALVKQVTELTLAAAAIPAMVQLNQSILSRIDGLVAQQERLTPQHLQDWVLDPMARQIFQMIDLLDDCLERNRGNYGTRVTAIVEMATAVRTQALEFLGVYGIESYRSTIGSPLDPRTMAPFANRKTYDKSQEKRVVRSIRRGFRRGEQIVRCEKVEIFRYEPPSPSLPVPEGPAPRPQTSPNESKG